MPELPELDVVCEVLTAHVVGRRIDSVRLDARLSAVVVRDLTFSGAQHLLGATVAGTRRRGKFIVFDLHGAAAAQLIINPKLTGRLQWAAPGDKTFPRTVLWLGLHDGRELRYFDAKQMGQVYVLPETPTGPAAVPGFAEQGPEPESLDLLAFAAQLRRFQGEIKGVLCRGECVAGIGNAYADEILWAAKIHPYRKRASLSAAEVAALHTAIARTLGEARDQVRSEMGVNIHLKPRDFLNVHMKSDQPCPRCGGMISEVSANQRITNFCRTCQPGGLIKGM
jgi:formamidopyrimidine-DNA glycosylase